MWTNELFKSSIFGTLKHGKPDSDTLKPISEVTPIVYPKPNSVLTFDKRLPSIFPTPITKRISLFISGCMILTSPSATICPGSGNPRASTAQLASTKSFTRTRQIAQTRALSSTRRTVSIAKLAISRTRPKT